MPLRPGTVLDLDRQEVRGPDSVARLTTLERRLLSCLAAHRGEVVSRDDLLIQVWGYKRAVATHAVENAVMRARQKIEVDPSRPRHLLTAQGEGYRLVTSPAADAPAPPPDELNRGALEAQVRAALTRGRLVTLVGPPGSGRRVLALRCAGEDARVFLDATPDDELAVAGGLSQGRALVTAAAPLGLPGEQVVLVPPLDEEAIHTHLRARFSGEAPEELAALRALAREVEGSPLSLQLVVAQLDLGPPSVALARWRAAPLTLRLRSAPEGRRSWTERLEATWARLPTPVERLVVAAAWFAGPAPVGVAAALAEPEGAEHVATARARGGFAEPEGDALERAAEATSRGLGRLLLVDGEPSLVLTALVASFARTRTPAHAHRLAEAHAAWALSLGQRPGARWTAEIERAWRRRAERADEQALRLALLLSDRLRSGGNPRLREEVLEVATRGGPPDLLAAVVVDQAEWLRTVDRLGDARIALDRARAMCPPDALLPALALHEAVLAWRRAQGAGVEGAPEDAYATMVAAREVARAHRDGLHEARCTYFLATLDAERGRLTEAARGYDAARATLSLLGRLGEEARVLNDAGVMQRILGHHDQARVYLERALGCACRGEDPRAEALVRTNLGSLAAALGDWPGARAAYREALAVHRSNGTKVGEGTALNNLADLELEVGELAAAGDAALAAVVAFADGDAPVQRAVALGTLACVRALEGRHDDALVDLRVALQLHEEAGVTPRAARTRLELGVVLHHARRLDEAAQVVEHAGEELARVGDPHRRLRAAVHRVGVGRARGEDLTPLLARLPPREGPTGRAWAALAAAWASGDAAPAEAAVEACQAGPGRPAQAGAWWLRLALECLRADLAPR